MGEVLDPAADVALFMRSMSALLDDPAQLVATDPAADSAENRAIVRASAQLIREQAQHARTQAQHTRVQSQVQARRAARARAVVEHLELLQHRHPELRDNAPRPGTASPEVQQATGMLMLMLGLDSEHAAQLLSVASWRIGRTPDEIACEMAARCGRGEDALAVVTSSDPGDPAQPPVASLPDGAPLALRRALEFIEQNAEAAITVQDIAVAARLGTRALQYTFRRYCGSTPLRYLHRVRISRAHRDLVAADPTRGDTVSDISARWQFTHPGRFSVDYRQVYGVRPSETLRR